MDWLSIAGAVFLVWLILVFLFTPGINYHLSRRTSIHDPDFLYTLQSTCQAALHHGNRVRVYTNGAQFYPAMLEAIRGATRSINMECYIFQPGRIADQFIDALSVERLGLRQKLDAIAVGIVDRGRLRRAGVLRQFGDPGGKFSVRQRLHGTPVS